MGIEDADVAAEAEEDATCFEGEEAREGTVGYFVSPDGYMATSFLGI